VEPPGRVAHVPPDAGSEYRSGLLRQFLPPAAPAPGRGRRGNRRGGIQPAVCQRVIHWCV